MTIKGSKSIKALARFNQLLQRVVKDTVHKIAECQLLLIASSLAYTTILSIIPLLAVSFAIFQAFGGLDKVFLTVEPFILRYIAEGASEETLKTIHNFIANIHTGTVGITGLIGLIFTSMSMLSSIEKAINRIWNTPITRSLFNRIAAYWLFITLGPLGASVVMGVSGTAGSFHFIPSGLVGSLAFMLFFFAVYKGIPNRPVHFYPALFSALFTATAWSLARAGFAIYTRNVLSYNKIYGSLGAIPLMILWIYILWIVILTGAALGASIQIHFEEAKKN